MWHTEKSVRILLGVLEKFSAYMAIYSIMKTTKIQATVTLTLESRITKTYVILSFSSSRKHHYKQFPLYLVQPAMSSS